MFKKKLEEQDLLGGNKDDKPAEEKKPEQGAGYDDAEREKLDKLFNEPAVNPPAVNQ
jgi:hypothetical protein